MTPAAHTTGPDDARLDAFIARVRTGEVRAGARLMRLVDDRHDLAPALLARLHQHTGRAHVIGITGNPGSGKSTLTNQVIAHYRRQGLRVAVIAVDPSSPFSGGAILGDRIRMNDHALDRDVFIRSLATRGHLGGVSRSTYDTVAVLDAMGYDVVLVETVGVGQDEVEVVRLAHTVVVVSVPGLGDDIQAIKAGLLEIADIFVVNKADRDGADRTIKDIRGLQALAANLGDATWTPPIVRTVAPRGEGVPELLDALAAHRAFLPAGDGGAERERARLGHVLEGLVRDGLTAALQRALPPATRETLLERLRLRETDPYTEAERLLADLLSDGQEA